MKMLDGNSAALSQHEALQDARQKTGDRLLPKAEALLREWVRDGEKAPNQFRKLSPFILADMITDDPYQYGLDNELVANLIVDHYMAKDSVCDDVKRLGDNAYDAWLRTPEASNALDDIVEYLEECAREDSD